MRCGCAALGPTCPPPLPSAAALQNPCGSIPAPGSCGRSRGSWAGSSQGGLDRAPVPATFPQSSWEENWFRSIWSPDRLGWVSNPGVGGKADISCNSQQRGGENRLSWERRWGGTARSRERGLGFPNLLFVPFPRGQGGSTLEGPRSQLCGGTSAEATAGAKGGKGAEDALSKPRRGVKSAAGAASPRPRAAGARWGDAPAALVLKSPPSPPRCQARLF